MMGAGEPSPNLARPSALLQSEKGPAVLTRDRWDVDVFDDLTVNEDLEGRIVVHAGGALALSGVAKGGVVVLGGGFARIAGKTHGLFVAAGGRAVITGTCVGSVISDGGDLIITGAVAANSAECATTRKRAASAPIPPDRRRSPEGMSPGPAHSAVASV
jgi:hypothetical protein